MKHAIVFKSKRYASGWEILYGHDCFTPQDMQSYCDSFKGLMKVVELPFDMEDPANLDYVPEPPKPSKPTIDLAKISPEAMAEISAIWDSLMDGTFKAN
jgi:hypothetical protein